MGFYADLFGWEFEDRMPAASRGHYFVAKLRGRDVAAVGSQPDEAPLTPVWNTYVWVDSADAADAKVKDAGGSVLMETFDVLDAGRMAVFSDPSGAVFRVWQGHGAALRCWGSQDRGPTRSAGGGVLGQQVRSALTRLFQ